MDSVYLVLLVYDLCVDEVAFDSRSWQIDDESAVVSPKDSDGVLAQYAHHNLVSVKNQPFA